jgi:hypothetical protein
MADLRVGHPDGSELPERDQAQLTSRFAVDLGIHGANSGARQ